MYKINEIDYEVGKIEFQQNIELMKYFKEKLKNLNITIAEDNKDVKFNLTEVFSQVCEKNLLGEVISFMIKPVGGNWDPLQATDKPLHQGIERLYEDDIADIWNGFWSKKKTLIGGMLSFSSLAAGMLK